MAAAGRCAARYESQEERYFGMYVCVGMHVQVCRCESLYHTL